jgi:hypothetical protein
MRRKRRDAKPETVRGPAEGEATADPPFDPAKWVPEAFLRPSGALPGARPQRWTRRRRAGGEGRDRVRVMRAP